MRRPLMGVILVTLVVFCTAYIVEVSTLEEAKALGEKAAAYVKANGKEKRIAEIGKL